MGLLRFLTPRRDRIPDAAVGIAYVAGLDGIPTRCHKSWEDERLLRVERTIDESGNLYIPWHVEGHGELLLSTASLMERERPYLLVVELARGTLNRLRSRSEMWELGGLNLSDELVTQIRDIAPSFILAATSQDDEPTATAAAEETIRKSLDAINLLGQEYARQVLGFRREENAQRTTLLAGNLGNTLVPANAEPMYYAAFNSAVVPFRWKTIQPTPDTWDWTSLDKQMQWCRRHALKVLGGPLLQMDRQSLPDWVTQGITNFDELASAIARFVVTTVQKYRGEVHLWHCVAGMNSPGIMRLSDDQKVRLTVMCVEATRQQDTGRPFYVSFDQPWAEYMATCDTDLSPMHFADMLVRAELGIAAIGLELNYGYWPGASFPRDVLQMSEHIDDWTLLGLPLIVSLAVPSGSVASQSKSGTLEPPLEPAFTDGSSPQRQKELVDGLLPVLLAKRPVQAVVWNQLFDSAPLKFADAGLFDAENKPKPALSSLITARRDFLQ